MSLGRSQELHGHGEHGALGRGRAGQGPGGFRPRAGQGGAAALRPPYAAGPNPRWSRRAREDMAAHLRTSPASAPAALSRQGSACPPLQA